MAGGLGLAVGEGEPQESVGAGVAGPWLGCEGVSSVRAMAAMVSVAAVSKNTHHA